MLASSCGDATIEVRRRLVDAAGPDRIDPHPTGPHRIGGGVIGSLVLHVVAVSLIVLVLPSLLRVPPAEILMPIDLVRLGDTSASPTPEPLKAKARPKSDHPAMAAPPSKAPPVDDLEARLKSLARQQQLQASKPPNPRLQDGVGASNVTASSDSAAIGRQATYDAKDFIRVQIERHWRPDVGALGAGDVSIAIHVTINRDGSVGSAEIVEDAHGRPGGAYRALALSARNAALLASPLTLPPGRYDDVRDVTLTFHPKDALR